MADLWAVMQAIHVPGPGVQYVSTTGNDANSGTSVSRKRTVQAAINALGSSGGIVYVASGSYGSVGMSRSGGTNSSFVLVKSENLWGAISSRVTVSGTYLGVYGFAVDGGNGGNHCINVSSAAWTAVWRCHAYNTGSAGIAAAGNNSNISNVSWCFNVIHDTSYTDGYAQSNMTCYRFNNAVGSQSNNWVHGYDNVIVGNIFVRAENAPTTAFTDGNGLIIDDMMNLQNTGGTHVGVNYNGNWLVLGNLAVNNGTHPSGPGVGLHIFQTNNVDMAFNTTALNGGVAMDVNAGASSGNTSGHLVLANLTWQSNWWDGYNWTGSSDANVFLQGVASPAPYGRGPLSGSRNRTTEGGNYFKTNSPNDQPNTLELADQWRPDGGAGAVETYTISAPQYTKWSVWPDVFGDYRPANQVWAIGFTERTASTPPTVPVASFTKSATSVLIGVSVSFTDTSTNTPTSWAWGFGDNTSSTSQNPTKAWAAEGTYTVTLTATNASGSSSTSQTVTVTSPPGNPPVANFTYTPTSPSVNQTVSFTDTSTSTPTSWAWDFGD